VIDYSVIFNWIAMAGTLIGAFLIARKNRNGFLVQLIGCIFWMLWGISIGFNIPIIATNVIFSGIDVFGFLKWDK